MDGEEARTIGWALWRARAHGGESLRVVAEPAGMSIDTLDRIERGLLSPTPDQVYALAEVLGVSVSELTRHEDAVRALRTAERIYPTKVLRNQAVRDSLVALLKHSRRGSTADQELRGLARRARLLV